MQTENGLLCGGGGERSLDTDLLVLVLRGYIVPLQTEIITPCLHVPLIMKFTTKDFMAV